MTPLVEFFMCEAKKLYKLKDLWDGYLFFEFPHDVVFHTYHRVNPHLADLDAC